MEETEILKNKLAESEKEKNEYLEGWKRAKADLINYKKEEGERFKDFANLTLGIFMKELVAVVDAVDSGLAQVKEDGAARQGLDLIRAKLFDILKKFGLEEIKSDLGRAFDPARQEAVGEVESDQPAGTVAEEVEKGYLLNGRVLKPAKVKVAKSRSDQ